MAEGITVAPNNYPAGTDIAKHDYSAARQEEELLDGISFAEIRARSASEVMPAAGK